MSAASFIMPPAMQWTSGDWVTGRSKPWWTAGWSKTSPIFTGWRWMTFIQLEGFADKSAQNLHRAIQDKKKPRLDRFLYALGIRHVGRRMARILATAYPTLDALREAEQQDLEQISEIGPEIAESIADFFKEAENKKVLERLVEAGVKIRKMPGRKKIAAPGQNLRLYGQPGTLYPG